MLNLIPRSASQKHFQNIPTEYAEVYRGTIPYISENVQLIIKDKTKVSNDIN